MNLLSKFLGKTEEYVLMAWSDGYKEDEANTWTYKTFANAAKYCRERGKNYDFAMVCDRYGNIVYAIDNGIEISLDSLRITYSVGA